MKTNFLTTIFLSDRFLKSKLHVSKLFLSAFFLCALPAIANAERSPVKVGVIIPMSGDWKVWGDRIRDGIELFQSERKSTLPLKLFYQDEATCDPQKALTGYKFLRAKEDIHIFILGCMNGARAILPSAGKEPVFLLSAGFEPRELFENNTRLINLALQIDSEAHALSKLIQRSNVHHLALLRNEGTDSFANIMKAEVSAGITVDEIVPTTEQDFRSILLRFRKNKIDSIFVNLGESQMASLLSQINSQPVPLQLFSSYGVEILAEANKDLRRLLTGVMFSYPKQALDTSSFDSAFYSRVGTAPIVNSYFVYDGLKALEQSLKNCEENEPQCLFNSFATGSPREGLSGTFTIQKDGSIDREFGARRFTATGVEELPSVD